MGLEEGLADLMEEIFGASIVEKAAFPGENFAAIGKEDILVCEGWNEGRIHERGSVPGPFEGRIGSG